MAMFDTSSELFAYYDEEVRLTETQRGEMRSRRDSNRDRLEKGLARDDQPAVVRNIIQGSYAMWTMVQNDENDYDIDDGAVFTRDSLKGTQGGDKSPLLARQMVCDALQDGKFKRQPEVIPKCVRVFYDAGYHVDIPVYRTYTDEDGHEIQELAAASEWKLSDPEAITDWFKGQVSEKSPDTNNGRQMRRMVCLLKKWARSRVSWNLPSGLILSVLVDEAYQPYDKRDDMAFFTVLQQIRNRLQRSKSVLNPVDKTEDFAAGREAKVQSLLDTLDIWLPTLDVLAGEGCTKNKAMDAWRAFFNDDFFLKFKDEESGGSKSGGGFLSAGTPTAAVTKAGQRGFA